MLEKFNFGHDTHCQPRNIGIVTEQSLHSKKTADVKHKNTPHTKHKSIKNRLHV